MTRLHRVLFAILISSVAAGARADLIPPDVSDCRGKQAGDSCTSGHCESAKCSRLDYAHWDRDASATPPTLQEDCLKCVSGASAKPAPSDAGSDAAPPDSPSARDASQPREPERGDASDTNVDDADKDDKGCSIAASPLGSQVAAFFFAGVAGLLISRSLRRRP